MLRIFPSTSAAAAKKYFRDSLSCPDYYAQRGQSPGLWFGEGAKRLGLEGNVTDGQFTALADNKDPESGKRLTVRDKENRRPGYDFVFSPPKGVSALWALTGDDRIAEAFKESVLETLQKDIEPEMKTRLRRGGQRGEIETGNLVGSLFLHTTTRPLEDGKPDPHIHIHAYIHNVTWAEHESRWQAGEFHDLHIDRPYLEAAYMSRLARRLGDLGYGIERTAKGWDIAGVPASVRSKFSRRTAEVEAAAKRLGITNADQKAELGATTRRHKEANLDAKELVNYWDSRLTGEERQALAHVRLAAQRGGEASRGTVTPSQAMEFALDHLLARDSAVPEKAVLEHALEYGVGSVTPEEAKHELSGHGIIAANIDGRRVVTTREVLAEEQAMVELARQGQGQCAPVREGETHQFQRGYLSDAQKTAVSNLLATINTSRVAVLIGKAGTGKTTLLQEFADALAQQGKRLLAFAPSAQASRGVLREKGFAGADTVEMLLTNEAMQAQVEGQVILIDEAGLAGTRSIKRVFDLANERKARVVLVGDPKQHRGVPRGHVLSILTDQAGLKPIELSEIRRQTDKYRQAVELLSRGRAQEGFDRLDDLGFVAEIADADERYQALARDYADALANGQTALIVAPTHFEGKLVNDAVRAELRKRGRLTGADHPLVRLESKGLTDAQKRDPVFYEQGDQVQWNRHAPGFKAGERLAVMGRDGDYVRVVTATGQERQLPLALAERFELYRPTTIELAVGDTIRMTRNGRDVLGRNRVSNGELRVVNGFAANGNVQLDDGKILHKDFGHWAPGVITSHASQGKDADVVMVAQSTVSLPATSAEQLYVSASRGKHTLKLFTDDKAALRKAVSRTDQSRTASEVWQAQETESSHAKSWRDWRWRHFRRRLHLSRLTELGRSAVHLVREVIQPKSVQAKETTLER